MSLSPQSLARSVFASIVSVLGFAMASSLVGGWEQPFVHAADDWSRFRGPNGSGIADALHLPNDFTLEKHTLWKVEAGGGNSSVVSSGKFLFVTSHDGNDRCLAEYDLQTGDKLWERKHSKKRSETATPPNSPATCSPACNGAVVVAHFPDTGLFAYDHQGNLLWEADIGPFYSMHGISASPILVDGKVIVVIDQLQNAFTVALDEKTGKEVWRSDRLLGVTGGYSSPVLHSIDGTNYILSAAPGEIVAYHVATGEKVLSTMGLANAPVGQPVIVGNRLFYSEPQGEPIPMQALGPVDKNNDGVIELAEVKSSVGAYRLIERIDTGFGNGDGKVDQAEWDKSFGTFLNKGGLSCVEFVKEEGKLQGKVQWRYTRSTPYISSVVVVDDTVYIVNDGGLLVSFDAENGKVRKQARLSEATGQYYASPIAADNRLVLASRDGKVSLIQHAKEWEVLNTVDFGDSIVATPTICQGKLLVRSGKFLYCLGS